MRPIGLAATAIRDAAVQTPRAKHLIRLQKKLSNGGLRRNSFARRRQRFATTQLAKRPRVISIDGPVATGILGACGEMWRKMGAYFMLLTGSFRRALDDKLRLAVPKPLREQLTPGEPLFLTPGLDGCLAIYSPASFAGLADRLEASSPAAREVRDYSRLFFSQAAAVTPDAQWRLRVPEELTRRVGLVGEVMIVGVRDHMEVWAADKWDQYVAQRDGQYEQLAEIALAGRAPAAQAPTSIEGSNSMVDAMLTGGRILPR
jgi:MraZ protein